MHSPFGSTSNTNINLKLHVHVPEILSFFDQNNIICLLTQFAPTLQNIKKILKNLYLVVAVTIRNCLKNKSFNPGFEWAAKGPIPGLKIWTNYLGRHHFWTFNPLQKHSTLHLTYKAKRIASYVSGLPRFKISQKQMNFVCKTTNIHATTVSLVTLP